MTRVFAALRIALPPSLEDEILAQLHEAGTIGVEIAEARSNSGGARLDHAPASASLRNAPESPAVGAVPVRGPANGGWSGVPTAVAWFEDGADLGPLRARLEAMAHGLLLAAETIEEEPWVERQQASRRPIAVGGRFLIVPDASHRPAWGSEACGPDPSSPGGSARAGGEGRIVLVVPVGRAFGTGEHETTRLCLEELEQCPLAGTSVLDLGTGSGLLAMAAARLGARRVVGLDNDVEAAEVAAENLALNGIGGIGRAEECAIVAGEIASVEGPFDLILANLFPGALERTGEALAERQRPTGALVLSGFSPAEADGISRAFTAEGYRERRRRALGEWSALVMERAPDA